MNTANQTTINQDVEIDIFADLERDLAAAVAAMAAKKKANDIGAHLKAARARVQMPSCQGDEREELLAKIAQWEQATVWEQVGISALIERKTCECCGKTSHNPIGYFSHQRGRKDRRAERWVAIRAIDLADQLSSQLQRSTIFQDTQSSFCMWCLDTEKFQLDNGATKCLTPAQIDSLVEAAA